MTGYREYRSQQEMREHGWTVETSTKICNRCGGEIVWATSRNGKKIPLDANSTALHVKSCSGQLLAPSNGKPEALRNHSMPANESAALRESLDECAQAVRELCRILRARAEAVSK
jgi:hypothetical protein